MSRLERNVNVAAVVLPFVAIVLAGALLWDTLLDARDLAIFAAMYALSAIGVTVGFHRLLTNRAF
ncbi:MAG: acyl-CoA desaturase, partial [Solirubrobacteraceae bacterium]